MHNPGWAEFDRRRDVPESRAIRSTPFKKYTGLVIASPSEKYGKLEGSGSSPPEVKSARESSRPRVNSAWCRFHCNL